MTPPARLVAADAIGTGDPQGARWRRWEPHIHTPGTAMNDAFGSTTMEGYLDVIESAAPAIEALGITDYLLTRRYRGVRDLRSNGRIPSVGLLFCNIEMRLSIETKAGKGINLHVLVSPADPEHVDQVERFLAKLTFRYAGDTFTCTESDLRRLGRVHDSSARDDETALKAGVNQFKVDFPQFRELYEKTEWMQVNTLVAVAGSSNDGTAGLQSESGSFAATRREIESFAHIIFTATPRNIAFWNGQGALSAAELERDYRGTKPCLHGSDAHRLDQVARPDGDRLCWIKGDLTFEALRQACLEPRLRVSIGAAPPSAETSYNITGVATPGLSWLLPEPIPLNPGMIAIIGARGSGKTALADLIAHAGASPFPSDVDQSFVNRAWGFFGPETVTATWSDGSLSERRLQERPGELPEVHYLTQQFVDRLCSSVAESDELLDEIKRVVFLAHEPESRYGADDFESLVTIRTSETQLAVEAFNEHLDRLSRQIQAERTWYRRRSDLQRSLTSAREDLVKTENTRKDLIKPGGEERAGYYSRLTTAITARENELARLNRELQDLRKLQAEANRIETQTFPQMLASLQSVFGNLPVSASDWESFRPAFSGKPHDVLETRITEHARELDATRNRNRAMPTAKSTPAELDACSIESLKETRAEVGERISADQKNLQRLQQVNQTHAAQDARRQRIEDDLKRAQQSPQRLDQLVHERSTLYGRFFDLVIEQCDIMSELYEPLAVKLLAASTSASKLRLRVTRSVDVDAWAASGEDLLDLRKRGEFKGRGALAQAARTALAPAWRDGSADEVVNAMEKFRAAYDKALIEQSAVEQGTEEAQQWFIDLGRWLYSTDHIQVRYTIEYEGVPINQLSPGTRGIVLLLLYLALDVEDFRPLLIDQPEENLDPKSVYSELVQLFSEARLRRQVIIVTHNANLVVNTDVDQVIVASCTKQESGSPPQFHYLSGGLEDPAIRSQVCDILEGGETAFRQRAKRLRVNIGRLAMKSP